MWIYLKYSKWVKNGQVTGILVVVPGGKETALLGKVITFWKSVLYLAMVHQETIQIFHKTFPWYCYNTMAWRTPTAIRHRGQSFLL